MLGAFANSQGEAAGEPAVYQDKQLLPRFAEPAEVERVQPHEVRLQFALQLKYF